MQHTQEVPRELKEFRAELLNHTDLYMIGMRQSTFEDVLAAVASKLNIALDGEYEPAKLLNMLTRAMKNRSDNPVEAPALSDLQQVQLVETETEISLLPEKDVDWQKEFAHKRDNAGALPPYTVCNRCKTEFDCCEGRQCARGKPAQQLGWPEGHRGFKRS